MWQCNPNRCTYSRCSRYSHPY
ncbi:hypothetical protein FXV77_03965 [Sphingobacterium phlebotomi]|uniref:Uncharacterized protein n=1 Tax=Sphingobacterium phlebotomi TaxID=2605433 RepID=A0A5D4HFE8_9SPHI|nr:hypothetical protein FXV77_03965 [Sphingobacterium phlebotomi]